MKKTTQWQSYFIDISNAFNLLNYQMEIHNISMPCPALATALNNMYGGVADLYPDGSLLSSQVGTMQGDPMAMCIYAIATMPLIHNLQPIGAKNCVRLTMLMEWEHRTK